MRSLLIPAAIQRIRSFLIEVSGMKVKPWASVEETMDALHATLIARHTCQAFWVALRVLLSQLACDLKCRREAGPAFVVDNELLDQARYQTLLDEIRTALARDPSQASCFPRLAAALSAPALALLLLLGGAATVSCNSSGLRQSGAQQDSGTPVGADTAEPRPDLAADAATGQPTDIGHDTTAGPADAWRDTSADTAADASPAPDVAPARTSDARDSADGLVLRDAVAPRTSDGGVVTIQDIMQVCNVPQAERTSVLNCLASMRESWNEAVPAALAGLPCELVTTDLNCFLRTPCGSPLSYGEFDPNFAFYCPIPVYIGVRFV
jgi:hypothetical protein